jgi:hypothetical protein
MFSNCAYTFDVPAGTLNLKANSGNAAGNPLPSLGNMTFAADTYYFFAFVGTSANPQLFKYSLPGSSISSMLSNATGNNNSNSNGSNGTGNNGTNGSGSSGNGNNGANGSGSSGNGNNGTGSGG